MPTNSKDLHIFSSCQHLTKCLQEKTPFSHCHPGTLKLNSHPEDGFTEHSVNTGEDSLSSALGSRRELEKIHSGENVEHLFIHPVMKVKDLCELSGNLEYPQGKAKDNLRGAEWMGKLYCVL